jgi:hypothetical protein
VRVLSPAVRKRIEYLVDLEIKLIKNHMKTKDPHTQKLINKVRKAQVEAVDAVIDLNKPL